MHQKALLFKSLAPGVRVLGHAVIRFACKEPWCSSFLQRHGRQTRRRNRASNHSDASPVLFSTQLEHEHQSTQIFMTNRYSAFESPCESLFYPSPPVVRVLHNCLWLSGVHHVSFECHSQTSVGSRRSGRPPTMMTSWERLSSLPQSSVWCSTRKREAHSKALCLPGLSPALIDQEAFSLSSYPRVNHPSHHSRSFGLAFSQLTRSYCIRCDWAIELFPSAYS